MSKPNILISLKEASKISGYNPDYLGFLIRQGKLKGEKIGKSWGVFQDDLNLYLESNSGSRFFKTILPSFAFAVLAVAIVWSVVFLVRG